MSARSLAGWWRAVGDTNLSTMKNFSIVFSYAEFGSHDPYHELQLTISPSPQHSGTPLITRVADLGRPAEATPALGTEQLYEAAKLIASQRVKRLRQYASRFQQSSGLYVQGLEVWPPIWSPATLASAFLTTRNWSLGLILITMTQRSMR